MRRFHVLLLVAAIVAASSATTWVVAGAATRGKISGCVNNRTGEIDQMRFGRTPQGGACNDGETAITWNVRGPRGTAGPQGETGPPGPAGPGISYNSVYVKYRVETLNAPFNIENNELCDSGDRAIGGGWEVLTGGANHGEVKVGGSYTSTNAHNVIVSYTGDLRTVDIKWSVVCLDTNP